MKYQHRHHAGNFGDVLKHVALVDLLQRLSQKDKPWFFLDTHSGRGQYPIDRAHPGEAAPGVLKLLEREPACAEIRAWRDLVLETTAAGAKRGHIAYPGSPRIAQRLLRARDRAVFCELVPSEAEALSAALGRDARVRVECSDGWHAIKALLPPVERRGLVLVDPAYERQAEELDESLAALRAGLERFSSGVFCIWYPIKERQAIARWHRRITAAVEVPTLAAELCVYRDDSRAGLNGAGLIVVNPPWQLDARMRAWVAELHEVLAVDASAPWSVEWLIEDR